MQRKICHRSLRPLLYPDCVAKLFAALRTSNNRIRLKDFFNQCCALVSVLESILLILVVKIVLQHNPTPIADIHRGSRIVRFVPIASGTAMSPVRPVRGYCGNAGSVVNPPREIHFRHARRVLSRSEWFLWWISLRGSLHILRALKILLRILLRICCTNCWRDWL